MPTFPPLFARRHFTPPVPRRPLQNPKPHVPRRRRNAGTNRPRKQRKHVDSADISPPPQPVLENPSTHRQVNKHPWLVRVFIAVGAVCIVPILWTWPVLFAVPVSVLPFILPPTWVAVSSPFVIGVCVWSQRPLLWGLSGIWLMYVACLLEDARVHGGR